MPNSFGGIGIVVKCIDHHGYNKIHALDQVALFEMTLEHWF